MALKFVKSPSRSKIRSNPLFPKKKKTLKRKITSFIISLFFLLFLVAVFYFLLFTPFFKIKSLEITGPISLDKEQINNLFQEFIKEKRLKYFDQANLFVFDSDSFKNLIKEKVAYAYLIQDIEIVKKFPNKISLTIIETQPLFIYQTKEGKEYLISTEGVVLKERPLSLLFHNLIKITSEDDLPTKLGDRLLDEKRWNFIKELNKALKEVPSYFQIKEMNILAFAVQEIHLVTREGVKIYLDFNVSPSKQIENLTLVLKEKIGADNLKKLEYIDLRIEDRVIVYPDIFS